MIATRARGGGKTDGLDNMRFDKIGRIRLMAYAEKYALVRRPGCIPFVMPWDEWVAMSREPIEKTQS